ncbi:hypothetical protein LguiA_036216 [Lonicera macranthoides]
MDEKGVHGDIYDCVQVDKQPALTHPALFGHRVHRRPSKEFKEKLAKIQTGNGRKSSELDLKKIWLSGEGCPTGSIPLRRYSNSSKAFAPPGWLEDPKIGWWLTINENTNVGYWPNELFTSMNSTFGDTIRWGGQVFSPTSNSPPMGSGLFKNGNYNKTCYMRQVKANTANVVDVDNSFVMIAESRCYFTGNNSFKDDYGRYSFLFGGRGGGKFKHF